MIDKLNEANRNLSIMFGPKHVAPITLSDVEKVYGRNVLSVGVDAKTKKGSSMGYMTGILYLAPAKISGFEVCPAKSAGCAAACLFSAGRGRFYIVTRARIVKTLAYKLDTPRFIQTVKQSIKQVVTKAMNKNMIPVIRLNGTSDIPWELTTDIIQSFPGVQFYDYTKLAGRLIKDKQLPANYHLTFSLSESNRLVAFNVLLMGFSVAAVFAGDFPKTFAGHKVVAGDTTDLRFLDPKGVIVALKAKGMAKKDTTGFVIKAEGVAGEADKSRRVA